MKEDNGGTPSISFLILDKPCAPPGGVVKGKWRVTLPDTAVELTIGERDSRYCCLSNQPGIGTFEWVVPRSITKPTELTVSLTAEASGEIVAESLALMVDVTPTLTITGMEITQGIQTYHKADGTPYDEDDNPPDNKLHLVAYKDTIVRVYIDADRDGFNDDLVPDVTGVLVFDGNEGTNNSSDDVGNIGPLTPINGQAPDSCGGWTGGNPFITARPADQVDRGTTDHTLNFRIPAGLATPALHALEVRIVAPGICGEVSSARFGMVRQWKPKKALPVRYIRVKDSHKDTGTKQLMSHAQARCIINRAFDLLPSPPLDIGPAPADSWKTKRDLAVESGLRKLVVDLADEHHCLSEWFGICSDANNDKWVGLVKGPVLAGAALGKYPYDTSAVRGKLRQRTVSLYCSMSYGLFCPGTI